MNLLMVLHQYLPRHMTGTEQYVRSLALGLTERGHRVGIFSFEPCIQEEAPGRIWFERDEEIDGIAVHRIGIHPDLFPNAELADYENPLAAQLLGRYLDAHPVDVVHVFHARLCGVGAVQEPGTRGIPVVVNLMDFWFLCPNFLLLRRSGELCEGPPQGGVGCIPCIAPRVAEDLDRVGLMDELVKLAPDAERSGNAQGTFPRRAFALIRRKERLFEVLQQADEVVAPSKFLRSVFEAQGFPKRRIRHVPYGIDDRRFRVTRRRRDPSGKSALHLGYVGSLTPHKGVHIAIEAVRAIASPDLTLHVHGSFDANPPYSTRLRNLAAGDPRIVFHSAFASDQLGDVLASLNLLVVPSVWYENTPFSVLEALHAGLPVLASDLGGISELIRPGVNGRLFPAGDSSALAGAILSVLENRSTLSEMKGGKKPHSIEQNLDAFEALYAPLCSAGRA